jgi:hypothetical protein
MSLAPRCRHCGKKPACILNETVPVLCYWCKSDPKLAADYALPPARVAEWFDRFLDAMVLDAIERGKSARSQTASQTN